VRGVSEAALRLFEYASKLLVVAALGGDERAQAPGQSKGYAATANLVDEFLLRVGALGELAYEREELFVRQGRLLLRRRRKRAAEQDCAQDDERRRAREKICKLVG